jgi:hypothetical protein
MIDDADDADESERAEAAALAAALDGEPREPREPREQAPPDDALATALLLRHASERGDHAELSAQRAEAILSDVLREPARASQRLAKVVRLWPVAALLAAAAAVMLVVRTPPHAAEVAVSAAAPIPAPRVIPQASASLLAAQSALLQQSLAAGATGSAAGENEAERRYELELRAYRGELFRALHAAYPGKLGQLEPALQRRLRARRLR